MATEANKFKVGLFLIAGFLAFNGALIWIGGSRLFETTSRYVTYFAESVQGLDVGSAVKFRGVPLGRVGAIRVAPDESVVEVELQITPDFHVTPAMRATLASSGITGIAFVEIAVPPAGAAPPPPPRLSFAPRGAYIPSQRSFMTNLMDALSDIASQLRGTDVKGLVAEYRELAVGVNRRVASPEVDRTLASIAQAAGALEALAGKVTAALEDPRVAGTARSISAAAADLEGGARSARALLADPRLAETLGEVRAAAGGLRAFSERMNAEAAALRAGERLDAVERRVEGAIGGVEGSASAAGDAAARAAARWERAAAEAERSLQDTLARISRAAGGLENLARSLEATPSRLLLEKPPKEDFK
jgi:ABC-type transporter Mla subunit MlaD